MHQTLSALSTNYVPTPPSHPPSVTSTQPRPPSPPGSLLRRSQRPRSHPCSPGTDLPHATWRRLLKSRYPPAQKPSAPRVTLGRQSPTPVARARPAPSSVPQPSPPPPPGHCPFPPHTGPLHLLFPQLECSSQNNAHRLLPRFTQASVQTPRVSLPDPHSASTT